MADPTKNPRDEDVERRAQEEQSEVDELKDVDDPHAEDVTIEDEPDTRPENT